MNSDSSGDIIQLKPKVIGTFQGGAHCCACEW